MKMLAVCCLLLSAICLRAELAFKWTVEVSQPLPYAAEALQGETFNLEAKVVQYRVPMLEAAEATFYYQTPEMETSQWYTTPAAWDATTATASVAFMPAMDVGSTKYRFFFGIETEQGKNYRVFGTLRLKASPGFSPATLTPTDVRAEIIQEILEAVFEESDERYATKAEHAALATQVDGKADAFTVGDGLTLEASVLSADIPSIFTEPVKIQNGQGTGSLWIGGDTNADTLTNNKRHLARIVVPSYDDVTKGTTLLGFDSSGDADMSVANKGYDAVSFGGMKKITNATSPMAIGFCVTKTRGAMSANEKVYPMEMDANEVRFNVKPNVNGNTLATTAEVNAAVAAVPKITVDSTLSASSTNPIQNQAVKAALDKKAEKSHTHTISQVTNLQAHLNAKASKLEFNSDNTTIPYVSAHGTSMHSLRTVFNANNEADNWAEKFDNAKLTFEWWHQYENVKEDSFDVPMTAFRELANGGGGHTEVWKANVGFGAQDTFIGAKRTADGDGQFLTGYPRLHNHGQDIHEVSGFSRDSRDDETVWSHRLLLPWDLAKANDTSYLMAGVVWNGQRNLFTNGDTATFVQPLLPQNSGSTQSALPYAIPCFENSPVYWKGTIIWNDGTQAISKAVQIPWARVQQDMRGPTELALKSDIPSVDKALSTTSTNPVQNKAVKAALDGKADAQHTHAFEEMSVTVSGASYRWQWDETEGTFALVAEE